MQGKLVFLEFNSILSYLIQFSSNQGKRGCSIWGLFRVILSTSFAVLLETEGAHHFNLFQAIFTTILVRSKTPYRLGLHASVAVVPRIIFLFCLLYSKPSKVHHLARTSLFNIDSKIIGGLHYFLSSGISFILFLLIFHSIFYCTYSLT